MISRTSYPWTRTLPFARFAVAAALAGAALSAPHGAWAGPGDSDKLSRKTERQIAAFERMVDEALVDSPNFLVPSRDEARGIYMDGYGLIVSFETTLVGERWDWDGRNAWWNGWLGDDHRDVIVVDRDWADDDDDDDDQVASKKWRDRDLARQERRYTRGKTELVDVFLDHAELLSSLADTDWVELQASLRGAPYFRKQGLHRLVMRAKMADLRAFSDGKLTEDAMIQKIQTKES